MPLKSENGPSVISTTCPTRNGISSLGAASATSSAMPSRRLTSSFRSGCGNFPAPTNLITPWMLLITWSDSWFISISTRTYPG